MRLRGILVLAIALALTFTTVLAVQAGEGKGKVVRLDSAANVVILDDGSMYRMAPDTVIIVEEKPVKFEALKPGAAVVIRSGEAVQFKDGQYIIVTPSASPATR
jgi:c-di-GMP-binding flagellar brake protein YcgR